MNLDYMPSLILLILAVFTIALWGMIIRKFRERAHGRAMRPKVEIKLKSGVEIGLKKQPKELLTGNIENYLKSLEEYIANYRRTIVWFGIAVVFLMILYPPWIFEVSKNGAVYRIDDKYGLLFSPPDIGYHIYLARLFLQCAPIVIIIIFVLFLKKRSTMDQEIKDGGSIVKKYEEPAEVIDADKLDALIQKKVCEKTEYPTKIGPAKIFRWLILGTVWLIAASLSAALVRSCIGSVSL